MTYPNPLIKLSFGGTMADGLEIWSCGLSLSFQITPPSYTAEFTAWQEDFGSYVSAVENFVSRADSKVPTGVQLTWVKAALIGTDGTYLMEPIEAPATANGGETGGYIPQGALVYTLVSSRWKDPGRYNRFYLPTAVPTGTTGWRLTTNEANDAAASAKLFIETLNAIGTLTNSTTVVASPVGSGWALDVQEVRVGRLIDTQRRRRNAIAEDYSSETITYAP